GGLRQRLRRGAEPLLEEPPVGEESVGVFLLHRVRDLIHLGREKRQLLAQYLVGRLPVLHLVQRRVGSGKVDVSLQRRRQIVRRGPADDKQVRRPRQEISVVRKDPHDRVGDVLQLGLELGRQFSIG